MNVFVSNYQSNSGGVEVHRTKLRFGTFGK